METYKGHINEYIDWVSGINTLTGEDVTGGIPVSGGSIRELLLNRLKEPFVMKEDVANNKYRMFASEQSYQLWAENPSDNADLELFNFVRPSDYKLSLTIDSSNRFIRYGDTTNLGARIQYHWSISNDEGESSDNLTVTYTVTNSNSGTSTSFTRWYNRSDADPDFSIYEYLEAGTNTITIEARGTTTGARNSVTFNIIMLQLNLTSGFKFYEKYSVNTPIQIPYVFERNNTEGSAKIYFKIDEGGADKEFSKDVVKGGLTKIQETIAATVDLGEGQHSLQIWAVAQYNDGAVTVYSNLLYYTFTIASTAVGNVDKFINIAQSFESGSFPLSSLMLQETQYTPASLSWGYFTNSLQTDTSVSIQWKLVRDGEEPISLSTITANTEQKAADLQYIPTVYAEDGAYLVAYYNSTILISIPIYIILNNDLAVNETGFYELKMSAYGKTNDSADKDQWVYDDVTTTFTNVSWNANSGWYNNSFRTVGSDEYATINFQPFNNFNFSNGKTIEIEFESEKVSNDSDVLITIGGTNKARIEITPNQATLYDNANSEIIHTNYKSNERNKLAFIINNVPSENKTVESGLAYIVNNGILERANIAEGKSFNTEGYIKIGGSDSGVRVYSIRVYNYAITYGDAYDNYVYDNNDKLSIVNNNNIVDASGEISYDLCKNKLDTILISGDLSMILRASSDKDTSATDVTIERTCPSDATKNFKIVGALIRKHGQSTLNYPITSMKFWLNKSKAGTTPLYETNPQTDLQLNKNRYKMKNDSIPSNKFVLQANYADSSGVHNGGLLRLIQSSWYNANINGNYILRTEPQLFTTNETVTLQDGTVIGKNAEGKSWKDYCPNNSFPYNIQVAPDSFPCAVFYYDEAGTKKRTFLGQYVFMEDKKSDFLYGERSIYKVPTDPFCLTNAHKSEDTTANKIWDNNNVLRIEVLGVNNEIVSYLNADNIDGVVEVEDEVTGNVTRMYGWERGFEMIYPDPDDIEGTADKGTDKFGQNSKFARKAKPFVDWFKWVVSTKDNQEKFLNEAAQHLDLYKMAAYYIFVLRFGLVDSLERNAQIKTYDGVHFHYEPWDMDIALGNKNDGGIAYNPPIDRNTKLPGSVTTYAISGRSADESGNIVTSNWLWDALEAWPEWINTIVPNVADALYRAGLTYNNISKMFDENYANAWCEILYNKSGYFKYVESGGGDAKWLSWLQGARTSHRHWWLSTSMDYYDAKWFCGDYKNHYIYIGANKTAGDDSNIEITPSTATYMTVTVNDQPVQTSSVDKTNILKYSVINGASTKEPVKIYGANYMEEIDLSAIATGLDQVNLDGTYSDVLGTPLKKLNIGTPLVLVSDGYTTTLSVANCSIGISNADQTINALENLQYLNIRGQQKLNQNENFGINQWMYNWDLTEVTDFHAMGSGLNNFYSSASGNKFNVIEVPSTIYSIWMNNSSWKTLEFWDCAVQENTNNAKLTIRDGIPSTIMEVSLLGTTGSTKESLNFVRGWISSIEADGKNLSDYTLAMDKVNWSSDTVGTNLLTYSELSKIAQLKGANQLKGYIVLKNEDNAELTAEQLTQIKAWFGDTVFTKNSSGLVIDHKLNYVQINVGGDVTIVDGEVYLKEGGRASLNATRFSLAEDDTTQYQWAVSSTTDTKGYDRYIGASIIQQEDSGDNIAYIQANESTKAVRQQYGVGSNYDIKVWCNVEGVNHSTIVHVIGATYPTKQYIAISSESNNSPRTAGDYVTFYTNGIVSNLYVKSDQEYTATVNTVTYTFKRMLDNSTVTYVSGYSDENITSWADNYLVLQKGANGGLKIRSDAAVPQDDSVYYYTLTATVRYKSGEEDTASCTVLVMDDLSRIINSTQGQIYTVIDNAWAAQYGSVSGKNSFYRTDLLTLTGELDFSQYTSISNLITANRSYLFKYIPNITSIILDGCSSISMTSDDIVDTDKTQVAFDKMTNLRKLSIKNCTGFGNLNLSNNTELRELYTNGTSIDVTLPNNPKLTTLSLGTPSSISLNNPTQLIDSGVSVENSSSITSIDVQNVPSTRTYNVFAKLMNI